MITPDDIKDLGRLVAKKIALLYPTDADEPLLIGWAIGLACGLCRSRGKTKEEVIALVEELFDVSTLGGKPDA